MVKNVFDNNQKMGKTYIITGYNKVPTTVMTSHLWIALDKNSTKRNDVIYKPQSWMWPNTTSQKTEELLFNKMIQPSQNFTETRDSFIADCISLILKQHNSHPFDNINKYNESIKEASKEKICLDCGCEAYVAFKVCRNCRGKLSRKNIQEVVSQTTINPYSNFDKNDYSKDIDLKEGEPDFLNPNSYLTIIQLLQNIGIRAGIKQYVPDSFKEWLFVECNGLPYSILRDIMSNVWRYFECKKCFYKNDTFKEYRCYLLAKCKVEKREFDWMFR